MTPLDAMRDALKSVGMDNGLAAEELIDALNRRNVILVQIAPEVAPLFIQTKDSGK